MIVNTENAAAPLGEYPHARKAGNFYFYPVSVHDLH